MRRIVEPAVWFPAVRCNSGADIFTTQLVNGLRSQGIRAEVTWLPHRAEYLPWTVEIPKCPDWANIIHSNSWLHRRFLPNGLPIVTTVHLCVHDSNLTPYKSFLQRCYHRLWIKALEVHSTRTASVVTAVSNYTKTMTERSFGREDIAVVHNGVRLDDFYPIEKKRPLSEPKRLLYVGNWSQRKGTDLLSPILGALGQDYVLRYTADRNGEHLRFSVPSNSICIGRLTSISELRRVYQESDLLLFPSRMEGLPLTVLEAMACGLPVAAFDVSSLSEIIQPGINGVLADVDNVDGIVSAIKGLLSNTKHYGEIKSSAYQSIVDKFSFNRMQNKYIEIYQNLLSPS